MNATFKSQRKIQEETLIFCASAAKVFPQLCPTREYDWIETWKCDLLNSVSGYAEDFCTFQTDSPDFGKETWICTIYEPDSKIAYVRFGAGWIIRLTFLLRENQENQSIWNLQYAFISTNEKGNKLLSVLPNDYVSHLWKNINEMLNYYLKTGKCLKSLN